MSTRRVSRLVVAAAGAAIFAVSPQPGFAQYRDQGPPPDPAAAAGRSFLLPGWGQHTLGQRRSWVYAAVEAGLWVMWVERRRSASNLRDRYRDVAWESGRIQSAQRMDGTFAYYETVSHWTRSGAFDTDATRPGLQPEEDATTFNGSIWELARGIFLPRGADASDPGYQSALSYYQERAYSTEFLWDWTDNEAGLAEFRSLIRQSDDRFRQATTAFGGLLANHVLSGADAFLSARTGSEMRLRAAPDLSTGGRRWTLLLTARPF